MVIRAITLFVTRDVGVRGASELLRSLRSAALRRGLRVWTWRVAFSPDLSLGVSDLRVLCKLGVLVSAYHGDAHPATAPSLVKYLRACSRFYASLKYVPYTDSSAVSKLVLSLWRSLGEDALTRVAVSFGGFIETPYFPLATARRLGFATALRYVDLLRGADVSRWRGLLATYLSRVNEELELVGEESGIDYLGIDASLSPWMDESVAELIELLSGDRFPSVGSAWAIRSVNDLIRSAIGEAGVRGLGFNEVMLPVGEDNVLKERVREGRLRLRDLTYLAAYCVAGVDMVAVRANEGLISRVVMDLEAAYRVKGGVVGLRLIPVGGGVREVRLGVFGSVPIING